MRRDLSTPDPDPAAPAGGTSIAGRLLSAFMSGIILALLQIILAISLGSLIFAGYPAELRVQGIGLTLLGSTICLVVTSFSSSIKGMISGRQELPAALLAVIVASISLTVPAGPGQEASFVTAVAAIAICTTLAGFAFLLIGRFKFGNLVRYLPYPVVSGFLAGTGWLLILGALALMTGEPLSRVNVGQLLQSQTWSLWLPGSFFAVVLIVATRRSNNVFILPGLIVVGFILFHLIILVSGNSFETAAQRGWEMSDVVERSLLSFLWLFEFKQIYWPAVWQQLPGMLAVITLSAIGLLLNISGLELAVDREIDSNAELRASGIANMVAGLFGGVMGFQQLSATAINYKMGTTGRLSTMIAALFACIVLLSGTRILAHVPMMILGGLVMYLGLTFLIDWLYLTWFKISKGEYGIIILITLVAVVGGFLEAVAVGIVVAVILFTVKYSRINVVRYELPGSAMHSRVSRDARQRRALQDSAENFSILALQGFIFFGTADHLLSQIRKEVNDSTQSPTRYLLLDFDHVTGIDSTGVLSFVRLVQLAATLDVVVVFTGMTKATLSQLQRGGVSLGDGRSHVFNSLDEGIEWCENQLLAAAGLSAAEKSPLLADQWRELLPAGTDVYKLLSYLEKLEVGSGHVLMRQGAEAHHLYFIEQGQVTAHFDDQEDGRARLETFGHGIVGEIGFYRGQARTASVIVDQPSVIYRLDRHGLQRMEAEDPEAASLLHQIIINQLTDRVSHLVANVQALTRKIG